MFGKEASVPELFSGPEIRSKSLSGAGKVALTFDDGPDPIYTPRILEILRSYKVQATFFVLSTKAKRYPEIIEAILRDGHHLASHGLRHQPQLTLTREGTFWEMRKAVEILKETTGQAPRYYRPPWGLVNRWTVEAARQLQMEVVRWSCDSRDWVLGIRPQYIIRRVLTCRHLEGGIVLCHDGSFVPHRPRALLTALPVIISELRHRGWRLVELPMLFFPEPYASLSSSD